MVALLRARGLGGGARGEGTQSPETLAAWGPGATQLGSRTERRGPAHVARQPHGPPTCSWSLKNAGRCVHCPWGLQWASQWASWLAAHWASRRASQRAGSGLRREAACEVPMGEAAVSSWGQEQEFVNPL